jgi:hypothetical protein
MIVPVSDELSDREILSTFVDVVDFVDINFEYYNGCLIQYN